MDLKKRRNELKLSQTAVAVAVGVSLTTYQLWERGATTPRPENLVKLKRALQFDEVGAQD
jgi:transcriptional regulator with XRE-family HTH domain